MKHKICSLFLAVLLILTLIPGSVFALEEGEQGHNHVEGYCYYCGQGDPAYAMAYNQPSYTEDGSALVYIGETGYQSLGEAVANAASGDRLEIMGNITLDAPIYINKDLTLAGSGVETITRNFGGEAMITVDNGATVNIGYLNFDGGNGYSGYSIFQVLHGSTLGLSSGAVLRNSRAGYGGGVIADSTSIVQMNSGDDVSPAQITQCSADYSGGGIYSEGTVQILSGASVTGNSANYGGGIWSMNPIYTETTEIYGNTDSTGSGDIRIGSEQAPADDGFDDLINPDGGVPAPDDGTGSFDDGTGNYDGGENYGAVTTHQVYFDLGDGSAPQAIPVDDGAPVAQPTLERPGYDFTGWIYYPYDDGQAYTYDFSMPVYSDITIYATWQQQAPAEEQPGQTDDVWGSDPANPDNTANPENTEQQWMIYFDYGVEGFNTDPQPVPNGGTATDPYNPDTMYRDGYTWDGWYYYDTEGEHKYTFDQPVTSDVYLTGRWTEAAPTGYIVTYDPNDGVTAPSTAPEPVLPGGTAFEASASRPGYNFKAWYYNNENGEYVPYDFSTPVNSDLTLYAEWEEIKPEYTVYFDFNANGTIGAQQQTVVEGGTVTDPFDEQTMIWDGYKYNGWYGIDADGNEYRFDFSTPITADTSLFLKWDRTSFNVTYDYNADGAIAPETVPVAAGGNAEYRDASREGFTLDGWYIDTAEGRVAYDFASPVNSDITLIAQWTEIETEPEVPIEQSVKSMGPVLMRSARLTANTAKQDAETPQAPTVYSITWVVEGTEVRTDSVAANEMPAYGEPAPEKPEDDQNTYTFSGWDPAVTAATGDQTYYAVFTSVPKPTEQPAEPTQAPTEPTQAPTEPTQAPTEPTQAPTEPTQAPTEPTQAPTEPTQAPTEPTQAPTEPEVTEYVVSFSLNGHGTQAPDEKQVKSGEAVARPETDPTDENYDFTGWYTDAECTTEYDFATPVDGHKTLYAGWAGKPATLIYDPNDGTGTMEATQGFVGEEVKVSKSQFQKDGAVFSSFNTSKDGEGEQILEEQEIVLQSTEEILYAQYDTVYTVKFDKNNEQATGTVEDQQVVNEDHAVAPSSTYSAPNQIVDYWSETKDNPVKYDFANSYITKDTTLYAIWANAHTVHFDIGGHGTAPADQLIIDGGIVETPDIPVAEGWVFKGWYTDLEPAVPYDFSTPVKENLVLHASWEKQGENMFTVSFNMHGHGTQVGSQTVEANGYASQPTNPTASGWVFDGWFADAAYQTSYGFNEPVTANTTIHAKWHQDPATTFTVAFNKMGHGTQVNSQTVQANGKATRPADLVAQGFKFTGWYKEYACTNLYNFDDPVTGNLTLYAGWKPLWTVSFVTAHGSVSPASVQVADGEAVAKPKDPVDSKYQFLGWYLDDQLYTFGTPVTSSMTLVAKWKEIPPTPTEQFSVTFYTAHGVTPDGQMVDKGKTVYRPVNPSAKGYIFKGWYTEIECINLYNFNTPVTKSFTLFAKWEEDKPIPKYYNVYFVTDKGTAPVTQQVQEGQRAYKPADPVAEGFLFGGWYRDRAYTTMYNFNTPVVGNVTLYAKWAPRPDQNHVVTFNANGHGDAPNPQTVKGGAAAVKPADPAAVGYTFTGWFTDQQCTQAYNFQSVVTADITLFAGWAVNRYIIRFDANGGAGVMASISCAYDQKTILPPNAFAKTGFYFIGWNTAADGTGTFIPDQGQVLNLTEANGATVDLFAQWKNIYNVIEGANGKIMKGGSKGITFKTDGDYSKFTGIKVDGRAVPKNRYTSGPGSTVVTLNQDYVNELSVGVHTIRFEYTDGGCETNFEVLSRTPKTGDTNNTLLWIIIGIAALLIIGGGVTFLLLRRRRMAGDGYDGGGFGGDDDYFDDGYDDGYDRSGDNTWRDDGFNDRYDDGYDRDGDDTWRDERYNRGGDDTWRDDRYNRGGDDTWRDNRYDDPDDRTARLRDYDDGDRTESLRKRR